MLTLYWAIKSLNAATNVFGAFSEEHIERLTGVRKGQLRYWDKSGFFAPSFADDGLREAVGRVYSFQDLVALRVLGILRNQYGVSVQHLRLVKEKLSQPGRATWTGVQLYVYSNKVVWVEPGEQRPQEVASGQFLVPTLELEKVVAMTKSEVMGLNHRNAETLGQIEKVKSVNQSAAVISGTRIPVQAIRALSDAGFTTAQIIADYPDLAESDIEAALSYQWAA